MTTLAGDQTWNTARAWMRTYGVAAVWILLGAMLSPLLWKILPFVVIAPFVARARPIQLSPPFARTLRADRAGAAFRSIMPGLRQGA